MGTREFLKMCWLPAITFVCLFVIKIQVVNSSCVIQSGEGFRVDCGLKQSAMVRLRDFGGVKGWAGLGLSAGDDKGFEHSLLNTEKESESRKNKKSKRKENVEFEVEDVTPKPKVKAKPRNSGIKTKVKSESSDLKITRRKMDDSVEDEGEDQKAEPSGKQITITIPNFAPISPSMFPGLESLSNMGAKVKVASVGQRPNAKAEHLEDSEEEPRVSSGSEERKKRVNSRITKKQKKVVEEDDEEKERFERQEKIIREEEKKRVLEALRAQAQVETVSNSDDVDPSQTPIDRRIFSLFTSAATTKKETPKPKQRVQYQTAPRRQQTVQRNPTPTGPQKPQQQSNGSRIKNIISKWLPGLKSGNNQWPKTPHRYPKKTQPTPAVEEYVVSGYPKFQSTGNPTFQSGGNPGFQTQGSPGHQYTGSGSFHNPVVAPVYANPGSAGFQYTGSTVTSSFPNPGTPNFQSAGTFQTPIHSPANVVYQNPASFQTQGSGIYENHGTGSYPTAGSTHNYPTHHQVQVTPEHSPHFEKQPVDYPHLTDWRNPNNAHHSQHGPPEGGRSNPFQYPHPTNPPPPPDYTYSKSPKYESSKSNHDYDLPKSRNKYDSIRAEVSKPIPSWLPPPRLDGATVQPTPLRALEKHDVLDALKTMNSQAKKEILAAIVSDDKLPEGTVVRIGGNGNPEASGSENYNFHAPLRRPAPHKYASPTTYSTVTPNPRSDPRSRPTESPTSQEKDKSKEKDEQDVVAHRLSPSVNVIIMGSGERPNKDFAWTSGLKKTLSDLPKLMSTQRSKVTPSTKKKEENPPERKVSAEVRNKSSEKLFYPSKKHEVQKPTEKTKSRDQATSPTSSKSKFLPPTLSPLASTLNELGIVKKLSERTLSPAQLEMVKDLIKLNNAEEELMKGNPEIMASRTLSKPLLEGIKQLMQIGKMEEERKFERYPSEDDVTEHKMAIKQKANQQKVDTRVKQEPKNEVRYRDRPERPKLEVRVKSEEQRRPVLPVLPPQKVTEFQRAPPTFHPPLSQHQIDHAEALSKHFAPSPTPQYQQHPNAVPTHSYAAPPLVYHPTPEQPHPLPVYPQHQQQQPVHHVQPILTHQAGGSHEQHQHHQAQVAPLYPTYYPQPGQSIFPYQTPVTQAHSQPQYHYPQDHYQFQASQNHPVQTHAQDRNQPQNNEASSSNHEPEIHSRVHRISSKEEARAYGFDPKFAPSWIQHDWTFNSKPEYTHDGMDQSNFVKRTGQAEDEKSESSPHSTDIKSESESDKKTEKSEEHKEAEGLVATPGSSMVDVSALFGHITDWSNKT